MICIVAAYSKPTRVFGNKGRIPWCIKDEKKRFRKITINNVVIMGRITFEEIGTPLPDRFTIIVSSDYSIQAKNCIVLPTLDDAIKYAKENFKDKDICISGGEQLYNEGLKIADKLYITEIEKAYEGDKTFPQIDPKIFKKVYEKRYTTSETFTLQTYSRKEI